MLAYLHVFMSVELHAVLEPSDGGQRVALRHAQEDDLVPQHVLEVEVRGLGDAGPLSVPGGWQG